MTMKWNNENNENNNENDENEEIMKQEGVMAKIMNEKWKNNEKRE